MRRIVSGRYQLSGTNVYRIIMVYIIVVMVYIMVVMVYIIAVMVYIIVVMVYIIVVMVSIIIDMVYIINATTIPSRIRRKSASKWFKSYLLDGNEAVTVHVHAVQLSEPCCSAVKAMLFSCR